MQFLSILLLALQHHYYKPSAQDSADLVKKCSDARLVPFRILPKVGNDCNRDCKLQSVTIALAGPDPD